MEKTIRAKAMRAWGFQLAVRVETTAESFGRPFEGVVDAWDMEKIILKYPTTNAGKADHNRRELHWIIITDIIFLDEAEEKPEGDVAKERWEFGVDVDYNDEPFIRVVGERTPILINDGATPEQMRVATMAPEMLEVLEMVRELPFFGGSQSMTISTEQRNDLIAVITKARGGSEI